MKVLVVIAHPKLTNGSRVNKSLISAIKDHVSTIRNLYELYPNGVFDIKKEQSLLLEHDVLVFQFPIFWYSAPYLLKKYFEDILTPGFAYGGDEKDFKLKDKIFQIVVSLGARRDSYYPLTIPQPDDESKNYIGKRLVDLFGNSLSDALFFDYEQLSSYTKMKYQHPFVVFGAPEINLPWRITDSELNSIKSNYIELINTFHNV
ncbi:NAD(P)H-dependent oxidoreductase [Enterobacter vonholyi]